MSSSGVRRNSIDEVTLHNLDKHLSARPAKQELIDRNILKDDKGISPSLVAARERLQRSQLEDKLDQALQNRPAANKLVKEGILAANEAPPS